MPLGKDLRIQEGEIPFYRRNRLNRCYTYLQKEVLWVSRLPQIHQSCWG